jgi:folate-binding protein YgfZ
MTQSLRDSLLQSGAVLNGASSLPLHFGSAAVELRAALYRCALVERSQFARVLGGGPDLLGLLHRLSTADLKRLEPGEGKPTVLTSPKGRIVERLFVHNLGPAGILMIGGPGSASRIIEHLNRYTFSEETGLSDTTGDGSLLALVGSMAAEALTAIGFERPAPYHSVTSSFEGYPIEVLGHDGLSADGLSVLTRPDRAGALWKGLFLAVTKFDGRPAGEEAMESYRVLRGIPGPGCELSEEHNPLEAGLHDAISFDKGCYVGQEVIARLSTYDKVSREIMGLELAPSSAVPERNSRLFREGRDVGILTSAVLPAGFSRPYALAYVKPKRVEPGGELRIGAPESDVSARVVELPFEL